MNIAVIYFTESGKDVASKIKLNNHEVFSFSKCSALKNQDDIVYVNESISEWARIHFEKKDALVFVGAMGIAVRAIAGLVSNKLEDSPVIVIDDKGEYVIPVLSGHVGGANELANEIADVLKATAVITTSTDIHDKFSVDVFAKKNNLRIMNKVAIAKVSSKVLRGEKIVIAVEKITDEEKESLGRFRDNIELIETTDVSGVDVYIGDSYDLLGTEILYLKPMNYIIGIGCKKGKTKEEIKVLVDQCIKKAGISLFDISCIASIDVKKDEAGIVEYAREINTEFKTYSAKELQAVEGDFEESQFVEKQVGVGNVCERSVIAAGGEEIIIPKTAKDGVTVAIAKKRERLVFDYE